MWEYNHTNELYHWGKKGQKWGVRRYQNADGSLTELGKKRYARDTSGMSESKKKNHAPDADKWVTEDLQSARRLADESSGMANKLKSATESIGRNKSKQRMDLSKMTDKEMRDKINRELLERQYDDVFNPKKVSKGKEVVSGILAATGTVLGITSSALGIALAIRELSGKK